MSFQFVSRSVALEQIKRNQEDNIRRLDLDVSDCALSSWASSNAISAYQVMIDAWDRADELGVEYPVGLIPVLCKGDEIVSVRRLPGAYGLSWFVSGGIEGRRYFPVGPRSKVQKEYGLSERMAFVEADDYLDASCAGLGLPVWYGVKAKKNGRVLGLAD